MPSDHALPTSRARPFATVAYVPGGAVVLEPVVMPQSCVHASPGDPACVLVVHHVRERKAGRPGEGTNLTYCHPRSETVAAPTAVLGGPGTGTVHAFPSSSSCKTAPASVDKPASDHPVAHRAGWRRRAHDHGGRRVQARVIGHRPQRTRAMKRSAFSGMSSPRNRRRLRCAHRRGAHRRRAGVAFDLHRSDEDNRWSAVRCRAVYRRMCHRTRSWGVDGVAGGLDRGAV
jgi:hypothetical protein